VYNKILKLEAVFKSYNEQKVLNNFSLEIDKGERMCLLGPSGCGKTTALRLIAGLEVPDKGKITLDSSIVTDNKTIVKETHERQVGLVFQDLSLFPHLTIFENVSYALRQFKTDEVVERTRYLLDCVGMLSYEKKFPHMISGGEQQRIALARALAPKPKLMLMDEPFTSLDNRLRDEIRELTLSLLSEEDTSVIMVTHDPEEAMKVSDSIALMRDGEIIQKGVPYNIYNKPVDSKAVKFLSNYNKIEGKVYNSQTDTPFGLFMTPGIGNGQNVEIIIRPQHLKIDFDRNGKGPNPTSEHGIAARGEVIRSRFLGKDSLVELKMEFDQSILKASVPGVFLPPSGINLWLSVRRDRCFVFVQE
jgi:iron(III) transport system ATP-binding protein